MGLLDRTPQVVAAGGGGNIDPNLNADSAGKQLAGNYYISPSYLDSLYNGGKLTASQRESILGGSDPSVIVTNQYDLYYLTLGRLGNKNAVTTPGGGGVSSLIILWQAATLYTAGTVVLYSPPLCAKAGMYQAAVAPPLGTAPTNAAYWQQLTDPGPVILFEGDLTNPVTPGVAAAAALTAAVTETDGAALAAITIPVGKRYRVYVSQVRPTGAGTNLPTDSLIVCEIAAAEAAAPDGINNVITFTPKWFQYSKAAGAIAVVAAGTLTAHVRIELQ